MADSMTRPRSVSPSSIRALLDKGQAAAGEAETSKPEGFGGDRNDPLPRPGEEYRANARHSNGPELTLHFVTKDFVYEGFAYADFERVRLVPSDKPGGGLVLVVRFNGSVITDVRMEGRHLQSLYHWIGLHGVSWVWEHPGRSEFADDDMPVITRMSFDLVKR